MAERSTEVRSLEESYEAWLREQVPTVESDFATKREKMLESEFVFFRGTLYLWATRWPVVCRELCGAPVVLAVGDLHVENFGTWRDAEGRLVFGVNDFDEAFELPYASDLVRLAASAILAARDAKLASGPGAVCRALLEGYGRGLASGGGPLVIGERRRWLGRLLSKHWKVRDAAQFWNGIQEDVESAKKGAGKPHRDGAALASAALPKGCTDVRVVPRSAGVGSMGRARVLAVADWAGGRVAREAKALAPSACAWALESEPESRGSGPTKSRSRRLVETAVRCPDPLLRFEDGWVVRRLAPDSDKVALKSAGVARLERRMFQAMGREVANVHLASPGAVKSIQKDLSGRPADWLLDASRRMARTAVQDWRAGKAGVSENGAG